MVSWFYNLVPNNRRVKGKWAESNKEKGSRGKKRAARSLNGQRGGDKPIVVLKIACKEGGWQVV